MRKCTPLAYPLSDETPGQLCYETHKGTEMDEGEETTAPNTWTDSTSSELMRLIRGEDDDPEVSLRRARGRDGRFARSVEVAERDSKAALLYAQGFTYEQIAVELGYSDRGTAWRAVRRACLAAAATGGVRIHDVLTTRLDVIAADLADIAEGEYYTVGNNGKIVIGPGGAPLKDPGPKLAAIDRMLKITEQLAKIFNA